MEEKEYNFRGYTIKTLYLPLSGESACHYNEQTKVILIVTDFRMQESQIESFLCKNYPEIGKMVFGSDFKEDTKVDTITDTALPSDSDYAIDIVKDIQQHAAQEWKSGARQKVVGRSSLVMGDDQEETRVWISNREYQMTATMQKNFQGTIIGTQSSNVIDVLGTDGSVTSKNTRMGRLLSENAVGHHTCKTPKGEVSFDILSRAFFQSSSDGIQGIRLNWKGKTRNFPDGKSAIEKLNAESKGIAPSGNDQQRIIREQATLRLNPFLDKQQNDVKFSHVHDGTCMIVDGGPGTGKTTTLIQRLKLLINQYDLEDYRLNYDGCSLTDKQITLVSDPQRNWLFFSPNNLMRKYLRTNMIYEGLTDVGRKTVVWNEYLPEIAEKYYSLEDSNLVYADSNRNIFSANGTEVVKAFSNYYFEKVRASIKNAAKVGNVKFSALKMRVNALTKIVDEAGALNSVQDVYSLAARLSDYANGHVGQLGMTIQQVEDAYENLLKNVTTATVAEFRSDKSVWTKLSLLVYRWREEKDAEEELPKNISKIEDILIPVIRQLVTKIAMSKAGDLMRLDKKTSEVYSLAGKLITHNKLRELGEYALYRRFVRSLVKTPEAYLLDNIYSSFRSWRTDCLSQKNYTCFKPDDLKTIVKENQNKVITQQELALLIGFINNIAKKLIQCNRTKYEESNHRYIQAYLNCCIPVIGIDEATDYTLFDYYAIASLRDYRVSSVTLSGDLMQCMRSDGITDWKMLEDDLLFEKTCVKELTVSYRQSPELMKLAEKLYKITVGRPSPYTCNIEASADTPKPLWYDEADSALRAVWIADCIVNIKNTYAALPSIAIFVKDKEAGNQLEGLLRSSSKLMQAGIEVADCTNDDYILEQSNKVRIFEIDKVKGMEFDAVFFHDIDTLDVDADSINRFLYVGLSRAAFYIAVTTTGKKSEVTELLKTCFEQEEDWNLSKSDKITVGIDFGQAFTKVCIENEVKGVKHHKMLSFEDCDNPYCLPSQVHICSDMTVRYGNKPENGEWGTVINSMEHFKNEPVINADWRGLYPQSHVVVWFLTYVLFSIYEHCETTDFQIQIGVKADKKTFDDKKKEMTKVVLSSLRLMKDVYNYDFEEFKKAKAYELVTNTKLVEYSDALKLDNAIFVLPESYAGIYALSKSRILEPGVHLHVDIGYTKSQLSFFELYQGIPNLINIVTINQGAYVNINSAISSFSPASLLKELRKKAIDYYTSLKQLVSANKSPVKSIVGRNSALYKSVTFWGGGACGGFWENESQSLSLSPYPYNIQNQTFDLSSINLYDSSSLQDYNRIFLVAIGLSYRVEGDNIPLFSFDLLPVQPKKPEKKDKPKKTSSQSSYNDSYRRHSSIYSDYIDSGVGYRKILSQYQTPRIKKDTPEGYEHGLTEY